MNQTAETTSASENTVESFDELDLSPVMRRALKKAEFSTPSPIQAQLIPLAMEGEDVIGQARLSNIYVCPVKVCIEIKFPYNLL